MKIYGYVRVSTMEQNIDRQIKSIKAKYPDAIIVQDEYTGTKMDRPSWSKLYSQLKKGDVVVFDSVSRMSRDSEEGFRVYQELFERGCELIFLNEPHVNTTSYREALSRSINIDVKSGDLATDNLISSIMTALNTFMLSKVKDDIIRAFEHSQKEVDEKKRSIREGIAVAKLNGKNIGRSEGDKLNIKKTEPIKALIREYSRDFDGHNTDTEVLAILRTKTVTIPNKKRSGKVEYREISAKLSRNTLYKYKKEMKEGI